jgi:hypothetical protein
VYNRHDKYVGINCLGRKRPLGRPTKALYKDAPMGS